MPDFILFLLAILKESVITGIAPMLLIVSAAKLWARLERAPARKPPGRWQVWANPNPPSAGKRVA